MNTGSDKDTRITALSVQAMIHAVEAFVNCDASHDACVIWTRHAKNGLSMRFLKGMTRVTRKNAPLRTGHETTFRDVASVIPYGIRFICFAFNGIYRNRFGRGLPVGEVPKGQRGAVCG